MAEIKSTLDLIMEKTKGLTMTDEEKRIFKEKEAAGKVKGLVQKFVDGVIDSERFDAELATLKAELKDVPTVDTLIREECIDRIEPGKENERLLGVLEATQSVDVPRVREIVKKHEVLLARQRAAQEKSLMADLRKKGISGPSVIPNLEADPEWKEYLGGMKKSFKETVQGSAYRVEGKN